MPRRSAGRIVQNWRLGPSCLLVGLAVGAGGCRGPAKSQSTEPPRAAPNIRTPAVGTPCSDVVFPGYPPRNARQLPDSVVYVPGAYPDCSDLPSTPTPLFMLAPTARLTLLWPPQQGTLLYATPEASVTHF